MLAAWPAKPSAWATASAITESTDTPSKLLV
jgi:hypothetical protein